MKTIHNTKAAPTRATNPRLPLLTLCFAFWLALSVVFPAAAQSPIVTDLFGFSPPSGNNPYADLIQGSDGNFYGTSENGGANGDGTIFKITPSGTLTTLYSFSGSDGANPYAGLIQGSDGNFYGTTWRGGANKDGTIFKITSDGVLTTLYSFTDGADGGYPYASLIQAGDGNFYGTTAGGGLDNEGTVFKITPSGTLTTLYSFSGSDGANPYARLALGSDGNLYGTASVGGAGNYGTVFKITPSGTLTTLHNFAGGTDGGYPYAGLIQDGSGVFYGTTYEGGANNAGTVFKITAKGALTILYNFTDGVDGGYPQASLIRGSNGALYGTTIFGGADNYGTVFKITTRGVLTPLYNFTDGVDGGYPQASLVQGSNGDLYGTTYEGGAGNAGTVFQITAKGVFTTLYSLGYYGANPASGLIQAGDGNFYGTTLNGGAYDVGTVFQVTPAGVLNTLTSFVYFFGAFPYANLALGSDGNFYGTTSQGGLYGFGTIFQVTPSGIYTELHSFSAPNSSGVNTDGVYPYSSLVQGNDGNFYGTASSGGENSAGTIFKISPSGTFTTLYNFAGSDGNGPFDGLTKASDGNFYGTTYFGGASENGTVFKITPSGALTTLYTFSGSDGANPGAGLILGSDGNFYGMTYLGGVSGKGTIFKITPSGTLTTLHSFSGSDGANPAGSLLQAGDGNFYGTTLNGGANGDGTIFLITPSGAFTLLHSFSALGQNDTNADGAYPYAGLIQGYDGFLYGTVREGGPGGAGAVYRLSGIYATPVISSLTPTSIDAGSPAFTLIVKGSGFQPFSNINWNGSGLYTTYVSSTQLEAAIPASLIASPGTAAITVFTGAGGGKSNAKSFPILVTSLTLATASLVQNSDGSYTATITLANTGNNTASNVTIKTATLGAAATSTTLPVNIGFIDVGSAGNTSLSFPASAGAPGTTVSLKVSGTFYEGTFSGTLKVKLP